MSAKQARYTVGDINSMRQAISWMYPSNQCYYADERNADIERRLNTYMLAGVAAKDVLAAAQEYIAVQQQQELLTQELYAKAHEQREG